MYPEEVWSQAPILKEKWLEKGAEVFPHVKLKAEISAALRWDKHAAEWGEIKWTEDHLPILTEPEDVRKILGETDD